MNVWNNTFKESKSLAQKALSDILNLKDLEYLLAILKKMLFLSQNLKK